MIYYAALLLLASIVTIYVSAFSTTDSKWLLQTQSRNSITLKEKINNLIDLSSEKVVNSIELGPGEKCVVCRCWLSKKFPLCDGTHAKHNKETGDNVGPAIVSVKKPESA